VPCGWVFDFVDLILGSLRGARDGLYPSRIKLACRLEREQTMEERTVALQGNPEILSRHIIAPVSLLFQLRLFLG
jgi:hypothetical protein